MEHKTVTIEKYVKVIREYLSKEDVYDFVKFTDVRSGKNMSACYSLSEWVDFVKEHLTEEEAALFVKKVYPFRLPDGSDNEELKTKLSKMAYRVFQRKAGLIEIVDEITPSMNEYIYMLKLLRFGYKTLPPYIYNENFKFYNSTFRYNKDTVLNASVEISKEQTEALYDVVESRGLLLNNVTYHEAYKYLIRKGVIVLGKTNSTR